MASVSGMAWEAARRCFMGGFEAYQAGGPLTQAPWHGRGDKRSGLWTAGKDAARRREAREVAWRKFLEREQAVQ